jgi:hypothetical protein
LAINKLLYAKTCQIDSKAEEKVALERA